MAKKKDKWTQPDSPPPPLDENKSGIYKIHNIVNDNFYVGSAFKLKYRFSRHKKLLRENKHFNKHLQSAWNKYGEENFKFQIIENVEDKTVLYIREQFYIDSLNPCYNITKIIGKPLLNRHHTEEWKSNHSKKLKGRKRPYQSIAFLGKDNPFYGKSHKKETIEKMKKILKDNKISVGENNPSSKINWEIVKQIRLDREQNNLSCIKLSKKYNLSKTQILRIVNYQSWRDENGKKESEVGTAN
jgi:group I intron endonuclease